MARRWAEMRAPRCAREPLREQSRERACDEPFASASLLALAYPDRIAKNRGAGGAFLLANGRGANVDAGLAAGARAVSGGRRNHRQRRAGPHRAGGGDHAG